MKILKSILLLTCSLFLLLGCNNDDDSPAEDNQENIPENNTLEIGDYHEGGVIIYLDATGEHGLVCAITDQSAGLENPDGTYWNGCGEIVGANGSAIGTGMQNTLTIHNGYIGVDGAPLASELCLNYSVDGYDDWFLPSKDELNLMSINFNLINTTSLENGGTEFNLVYPVYWSSTEFDAGKAWKQVLESTYQFYYAKCQYASYVRAVRAF
jgi:hypothetical protein